MLQFRVCPTCFGQTTLNGADLSLIRCIKSGLAISQSPPDIQFTTNHRKWRRIRQVLAQTVDSGASDGPMTDERLQAKTKILHIPTVLSSRSCLQRP